MTTDQMQLFPSERKEPLPPHVKGSDTSREAAESIESSISEMHQRVYEFLLRRGTLGATDQEIEEGTGIDGSTERPRRRELVHDGYVIDSGMRRKTRSGRRAAVWMVSGKPRTRSSKTKEPAGAE